MMKDARTKTRIVNGAFNYVAPEVKSAQTFDVKSDLWSIGAVLLEIVTTALYDVSLSRLEGTIIVLQPFVCFKLFKHATFQEMLVKIRSDPEVLEKILSDVEALYERRSLVKVLRGLLQIESSSRFSMK